jgi:hypothetical protein
VIRFLKTKAEILKYVNESFTYVQKALATTKAKNVVSPIKSPFGEGDTARLAGRSYHRPLLRSLWSDGEIRAHEGNRAAGKRALGTPKIRYF